MPGCRSFFKAATPSCTSLPGTVSTRTAAKKPPTNFFDLNVRGTFEVLAAGCVARHQQNVVYILEPTSIRRPDTLYGRSKLLAEQIVEDFRQFHNMNVVTLRPRGFIPFWNRTVYNDYVEWARWFWRGAVHIDDVAAAVVQSLDLIARQQLDQRLTLTLDSAYDYTDDDLTHWDVEGAGSTFRKYYLEFEEMARSYGLDPAAKPTKLDIAETIRWLDYRPTFGLKNLLVELATHGEAGPPPPGIITR